jgi:hypothetical protein
MGLLDTMERPGLRQGGGLVLNSTNQVRNASEEFECAAVVRVHPCQAIHPHNVAPTSVLYSSWEEQRNGQGSALFLMQAESWCVPCLGPPLHQPFGLGYIL